jgi:hypothetical protein
MRLYGVQGTQSVRADDEPETRPNHRGGGQHSTVDHHRKASKAAHFSRKSAAPRLHRRLEKILPIEFFFPSATTIDPFLCDALLLLMVVVMVIVVMVMLGIQMDFVLNMVVY